MEEQRLRTRSGATRRAASHRIWIALGGLAAAAGLTWAAAKGPEVSTVGTTPGTGLTEAEQAKLAATPPALPEPKQTDISTVSPGPSTLTAQEIAKLLEWLRTRPALPGAPSGKQASVATIDTSGPQGLTPAEIAKHAASGLVPPSTRTQTNPKP